MVKLDVYRTYCSAVGQLLTFVILLSLILMEGSKNATDIWLANWINNYNKSSNGSTHDVDYFLTVYSSIAASNSVFTLARAFLFAYGGICAAKIIHSKLLTTVMAAKITFFDLTPAGRILNRFSSDLFTVDDSLPFIMNIFLAQLVGVVCPIIVCIYAVPWIVLVLAPLGFFLFDLQSKYRPASRDLKRINSVSLSPIYTHFTDTVYGLATIRAMKSTSRFMRDNEDKLEINQKSRYAGVAASVWLDLRLSLIGCCVVTGIAIIAVIEHHAAHPISAGLVGLAMSYALGITSKLSSLVQTFTETEREMVAVERVKQYLDDLPSEDLDQAVVASPYSWPSEGVVSFQDVNFRYRDHLPLALKNFTFETRAKEKVGIVGRTGAGKSSLFQALFRTVELQSPEGGLIRVDGVDIKLLSLRELRKALTIIPQDPFLFRGTLRENLDPLREHEDIKLWDALKKCHLSDFIRKYPAGLNLMLGEGGSLSFSSGQKQLVCLARAILSSANVSSRM